MNLVETIRAAIDRHHLIPAGTPVVVGVSGGADSVALLHAFHQLGIPCTVAHLNHGLRGSESDADEQFVKELANALGLPFVGKSVAVQQLAGESAHSIEMAARQARHTFFEEFEDAVIALAHHADDQAETFMLKLARGAGPDGLGGMPFSRQLGSIRLVRPMLEIPRSEIVQWLEANKFEWREDLSNSDEAFLRNRVRHTILPLLENELNPKIRETIIRTMDILREENAWMDAMIADCQLPMADLPLAARRRKMRNWLFEQGAKEVGFDAVEAILKLMEAGEGTTRFELNANQRIVVEYGIPRFEEGSPRGLKPQWNLIIEHGTGWRKDHGKGAGILPAEASFNPEKTGDSPIEVRVYETGDRIAPFGMQGSRKLQDIFTDQKLPRAERDRIPVVICRGEIIWLPGYRIARGWEVEDPSAKAMHIRIEQNPAS